jgi:carboxyl-terminal processing protease
VGRSRRAGAGWLGLGTTALAALVTFAPWGRAESATDGADQVRLQALEAERLGQWEQAQALYLRLLADERPSPDLRERFQQCVRHVQQIRRHRDPVYRARIQTLSLAQALAVYSEALEKLQSLYVERDKATPDRLFQNGLEEFRRALADTTFKDVYLTGTSPGAVDRLTALLRDRSADFHPADASDARKAVREAALAAHRALGISPAVVVLEFVCGACNSLDEYTVYLSPGQGADEINALAGELAAFGLQLTVVDRQFVVERVLSGSWAETAGVLPGDRVLRVGKQSPDRLTPEASAELLRGEPTWLTDLELQSPGEPVSHTIRLPTSVPSVLEARMDRDVAHPEREGIGYVCLVSFQRTTMQEMESALGRLRSGGLRVLILDLRGNPGGSFSAAVQVAERFLAQGVIVLTQGQVRTFNRTYLAQTPQQALDVPLVVLIDGDTASAAEVVAGALKENQRATLVGQPTYGKGSVQCLLQLQAGGGLRITLAKLFGPRGQPLTGLGVVPNLLEPLPTRQLEVAYEQAVRLLGMR